MVSWECQVTVRTLKRRAGDVAGFIGDAADEKQYIYRAYCVLQLPDWERVVRPGFADAGGHFLSKMMVATGGEQRVHCVADALALVGMVHVVVVQPRVGRLANVLS